MGPFMAKSKSDARFASLKAPGAKKSAKGSKSAQPKLLEVFSLHIGEGPQVGDRVHAYECPAYMGRPRHR